MFIRIKSALCVTHKILGILLIKLYDSDKYQTGYKNIRWNIMQIVIVSLALIWFSIQHKYTKALDLHTQFVIYGYSASF